MWILCEDKEALFCAAEETYFTISKSDDEERLLLMAHNKFEIFTVYKQKDNEPDCFLDIILDQLGQRLGNNNGYVCMFDIVEWIRSTGILEKIQ